MDRKIPVISCTIKQTPNRDPKFHIILIFDGLGRSIRAPFTIFNRLWVLRIGFGIRCGTQGSFIKLDDINNNKKGKK
jgi:hypothetical protein